jgi:hypothetical protein
MADDEWFELGPIELPVKRVVRCVEGHDYQVGFLTEAQAWPKDTEVLGFRCLEHGGESYTLHLEATYYAP